MEIKDILGIEPIGEAGLEVIKASVKGVPSFLEANITPSPLALNLYFKTHSIGISPKVFWSDKLIPRNEDDDNQKQQDEIDKMMSEIRK